MKGEYQEFVQYLRETKKIIIPIYQRNYEWTMENCKTLYEDLMMIVNGNRPKHFIGSIVSVKTNDSTNAKIIIDGQQRIITIYLIYLAIYNLIEEGNIETSVNSEEIKEEFLIYKYSKDNNKYKIIPTEKDSQSLNLLIDNDDLDLNKKFDSNIIENYKFIYNELKLEKVSADDLYRALEKLGIISITLDHDENPQLIFESLNSTGLALKTSDKIRNFLLMKLDVDDQNNLYKKYWKKIEITVGNSFEVFIKDYLIFKNKSFQLNRAYEEFKNYLLSSNIESANILKDMAYCAELYGHILNFDTDSKNINRYLQYFYFLSQTNIRPFLIFLLDIYKKNEILEKSIVEIFSILESYLLRRLVCRFNSSNLKNLFSTIKKNILNNEGQDYLSAFKKEFFEQVSYTTNRFPNDREFTDNLRLNSIGRFKNNQVFYILSRLENSNSKESIDFFNNKQQYQIEHVMPQKLSSEWKINLGGSYEKIHDVWLNRVGNLTLTGWNPELSNKSFGEKKLIFAESSLKLNQLLANSEKFGIEELEKRTDFLAKRAVQIWSYPKEELVKFNRRTVPLSLCEDEEKFTSAKILGFSFRGERYDVKDWAEMYNFIIKLLHNEDSSIFYKLAENNKYKYRISTNSSDLKHFKEIEPGKLFYNSTSSTSYKLQMLKDYFGKFDISQDDLIFEIDMVES